MFVVDMQAIPRTDGGLVYLTGSLKTVQTTTPNFYRCEEDRLEGLRI